ncbi:MAG: extracellular matrix/biofilm biosynthesis regulator RemA family protein [Bacillota bacterium]|nr:DUF370 domain-containing protein [Bacillota bacterium]MDD3299092.1 DUF370 domain-containing protein [Bacillota bacterium]MDD3850068.1 DUF370 domain-containing protein [Bacillota bacterium]MDD4706695.1 DUF370 domain-containing protein [Bacillota bacterium]
MFLHLGKNVIIHLGDVIAVIDLCSVSEAKDTGEFIRIADEEGFVRRIGKDKPKSMVICEKAVYFSPISSSTLSRRASFMHNISML